MITAFYSGVSGVRAYQTATDTLANNVANVNTSSFKSKTAQFGELLGRSMTSPAEAGYNALLEGSGAKTAAAVTDFSAGAPVDTGNALDFCPNGSGFFALRGADGAVSYTRDGSFHAAREAGGTYLENNAGLYVLDASQNRISVGPDGAPQAAAGLFSFANAQGLTNEGGNRYAQTDASGQAAVSAEGYRTGALEGSNVDLAQQMTDLIESERGFQLNTRVIQTADQIEAMVNMLKG